MTDESPWAWMTDEEADETLELDLLKNHGLSDEDIERIREQDDD
jgi:hypothetical protein